MSKLVQTGVVLGLALVMAAPAVAQRRKQQAGGQLRNALKKVELSEEQQTKVDALFKEYGPKLQEANQAVALTKEQRQARTEAMKKANEQDLKGKARNEMIQAALKLTDEQKEAQAAQRKLTTELRGKLAAILTAEQQEKSGLKPAARKGKGKGKGKGKKKKDGK